MNPVTHSSGFSIKLARVFAGLALLALIGAWVSQLNDGMLLGMTQQHLFYDSIALSLLGVTSFLDGLWHARSGTNV